MTAMKTTMTATETMRNGGSSGSSIPRSARRFAVLTVAVLCLAAAVAGPAAATGAQESQEGDSRTVVTLQSDGDAEVALTIGFDLTTDAERKAFESFRANETKQDALRTRYGDRMAAIAAEASNETDREMSVGDPSIAFETTDGGDRGVIRLSVTWSDLAVAEDGEMRVTEPFASGFTPETEFAVVAPEGHAISSAAPAPNETSDGRVAWAAGTDLSGFEVVAEDGHGDAESGDGAPGFGAAAGIVALLGGLGAAGYRRRGR